MKIAKSTQYSVYGGKTKHRLKLLLVLFEVAVTLQTSLVPVDNEVAVQADDVALQPLPA